MNKIKSLLALLAALVCGGAWAATPIAVWENLNISDEALTQNGMTLSLNLGDGESNNKVVGTAVKIGDKPITVTFGDSGFTDYLGTVVVQYSGISEIPTANTAIATFKAGTYDDLIGIHVVGTSGKIKGISGSNTWGSESSSVLPSDGATHTLVMTAKMTANSGDTTLRGTYAYIDGAQVYGQGGLVGSSCIIKNVAIGGENKANSLPALSGMIVEKIAVFNAVLTQREVQHFVWPSEMPTYPWKAVAPNDTQKETTYNPNGITYANNMVGICGVAYVSESGASNATIFNFTGDANKSIKFCTSETGCFKLEFKPGTGNEDVTSSVLATPGAHRFSCFVRRGNGGSGDDSQLAYAVLEIDGEKVFEKSGEFSNGPLRSISFGDANKHNAVSGWIWNKDDSSWSTISTVVSGYDTANDAIAIATIDADCQKLIAPIALTETTFTPANATDWNDRVLPLGAKSVVVTDNTSFAWDSDYSQNLGTKSATVAQVTGCADTKVVYGLAAIGGENNGIGTITRDVYLKVIGGNPSVISAGEDSLHNGNNKTKPTGNLLVNVGGTTTANHVMGAGNRGGSGSKITGHTGVVVEGAANIKGAIIGGWSSPHQAAPEVTGNTTVLIKNVQKVSETLADAPVSNTLPGWVIGGNAYLTNGGGGKVGGDSSVVIALDDDANGEFKKPIVGGSYKTTDNGTNAAMTHTGSTSVTISAPNDVTFSGAIYGACYSGNGGKVASVGGNSSVTINGGTYTGTIYAGGNIATYTTVAGAATLTINGGDLSAATLKGGQATGDKTLVINENVTLAAGSVSGFTKIQVAENKTLTLTVADGNAVTIDAIIEGAGSIVKSGLGELTLSGNNTYSGSTVVNGGMIKAEYKNAFGTGTVSISESAAEGAVIVVPAFEEATSFTVNSAVIVVLTQAQINGSFPLNTGIKTAANLQHTVNADDRSEITKLSASIATGLIYVVSSNKNVSWDSETSKWVDDDGNEVTTIDDTCTLVLNNGDDVSIPSGAAPSQITLPTSGRVAVGNIGNLADGTVIYIPEATTLALKSHTKTSNVKFDGPGAIELSLDSSNATGNLSNDWLDNSNYADSFSGRIVLIQGRFETAEILASRVAVEVRDGAQLSTGGTGEWNNHFILHGDGCDYERGTWDTSEAALRINNNLGSSAVLEFKQEDGDPKPVIGSHNHSATISAALKGTCGFKAVANENVTYTFKYNSASDLTGAVEFTNKVAPKLDFTGMSANQRINLGTSFNVPANKTLVLASYSASIRTTSETDKPGVASVVKLANGSKIQSDDGSYYFQGITVDENATATLQHKWAKGFVYKNWTVPATSTLIFTNDHYTDTPDTVLSIKSGSVSGTVNLLVNGGKAIVVSAGNSLAGAAAVNLQRRDNSGDGAFKFNEFAAFGGATITVNSGTMLDLNGKDAGTSGFCTVKLNGGTLKNTVAGADTSTLINKTWPATTWTLQANSAIGGTQAFGLVNYTHNATTINLGTFTLTKNDANHVVLCNTTINGTGKLLVNAGTMSVRSSNGSSASDATVEVNADATFDIVNNTEFSVKNLVGNGGQFTTTNTQNGHYKVTGALSGSGTFGRVTFADGATIDATSGTRTFSATPTFAGAIKVKGVSGATVMMLDDDVTAPTLPTNVKLVDAAGNETAISLEVVGSEVKIASFGAMAGGQTYETVEAALAAVASTKGTVIPTDTSAEVPADYADTYIKTTVGSATIIRAKDALIDWKSTNNGDWSAFNDASHAYLTQDGYDTTYLSGDTVCFLGDWQVYTKTATYGAKIQVGKDAEHTGFLRLTCSGEDCTGYILSGSQVTVCTGSTLKAQRHSGVNDDGWNSYGLHNGSKIIGSTIEGAGTFLVGKDAKAVIEGETKIATKVGFVTEGATADQGIEVASTGELTLETTTDSGDISVAGVISGSGKVKKSGIGTLTLSGANTFSGGLTINAGTVKAGVGGVSSTSSAVGTGTVIVGANGTFDVNGQVFDTNGNGYTIESAGTLKNGGSRLYANTRVIKRLELTGDTTIATGERFGMGIVNGGTSGDQKSYIVMNGHTLNIDTSTYFNLQNTEISGGGEIVVKQGAFLGYGKACSYDGTLKTTGTGKLELNNDCTLTFTVQNFELGSDQGVDGAGDLKVTGTLSTAANHNYAVPRLIMGDGATIKLADSQRVSATTKFEIGDHLNIDCSAVTDATFDAIEVPAAFHNADNWETNKAKLKSWIGSDYKVGTYAFANGNWLRILFGTEPQTKPTEVVTTDGETTIENVVLPMAITESGKTNQTAANGTMKVWEAYVLGLDYTSETAKPVVSSTQTAEAGSIKLVDNLTPKTDAGVNVTRKLFVGTTPGSMSEVQEASYDNGFTVDVPTRDDKVKYLKIKYDFAAPQEL